LLGLAELALYHLECQTLIQYFQQFYQKPKGKPKANPNTAVFSKAKASKKKSNKD